MRSIVLSLLLTLTGLLFGGAAHAQAPDHFPGIAAQTWIEPAALQGRQAQAILRTCQPRLALQDALPGPGASFAAADDCGGPLHAGFDDRNEMIWLDAEPPVAVVAYRSPRNAVSARGLPPAWLRLPLRPPRA